MARNTPGPITALERALSSHSVGMCNDQGSASWLREGPSEVEEGEEKRLES